MSKKIGILTSGGDCAGLNAVIRAVTLRAINKYRWKVFGIKEGTLGLMNDPPNDFSLDLYILYKARFHNLPILELPVFYKERIHGESKGGGTIKGKWKLILRTLNYLFKLKMALGR